MNYIVLDLEWNFPTRRDDVIYRPFRFDHEIIQFGAVKLSEAGEVLDGFDEMVKPVYYPKLNRQVVELTLISQEDVESASGFPEVAKRFREWCGEDFVFLSWGLDDMYVLIDNLEIHDMDADWVPDFYNVQLIFDDQVTQEDRSYALNYAMWKLGIKPMSCHNAYNDAMNTVEVMKHLNWQEWIAEEDFLYAEHKENEDVENEDETAENEIAEDEI